MISEQVLDYIRSKQCRKISERSPVWHDVYSIQNVAIDTTQAATLVSDIDCGPFALGLLFGEATFGASSNKDLYIDVRARPPGRSDYSSEPWARMILPYNTSSPYKRYMWLPIDLRYVDMLSLYYSHTGAAAAITLDHVGLRLVV